MDPFFARNRLSAYLDGELPTGEAREVEDALAQSAELRAELDGLRAAIALLRRGGPVPAPRDFARKLDARIAKEPLRVGWRRHLHGFRIEAGMLAAAAAIVLVFAAQKPEKAPDDGADGAAVPAPKIDVASVPGLEMPSLGAAPAATPPSLAPPSLEAAPAANGVLGDEPSPQKVLASKKAASKLKSAKAAYEKEPFVPAWEQGAEVPVAPPTVQSVATFKFRLNAHSDRGLIDLEMLAASLGGQLVDERGRPFKAYPMESGDTRKVKLLLPSITAGGVAARLGEYGESVIVYVPETALYATGATVPVVIEVTAP
ncbi:MAG: zf-HC2 domain-containing protein [Pseudomonadota bacterium]|nr:zf-HC2 domain-containing protein [Pseudomonadota bacterium]